MKMYLIISGIEPEWLCSERH